MTEIEIPDEAVEAAKRDLRAACCLDEGDERECKRPIHPSAHAHDQIVSIEGSVDEIARVAVGAAAPVLRAAWEAEQCACPRPPAMSPSCTIHAAAYWKTRCEAAWKRGDELSWDEAADIATGALLDIEARRTALAEREAAQYDAAEPGDAPAVVAVERSTGSGAAVGTGEAPGAAEAGQG